MMSRIEAERLDRAIARARAMAASGGTGQGAGLPALRQRERWGHEAAEVLVAIERERLSRAFPPGSEPPPGLVCSARLP